MKKLTVFFLVLLFLATLLLGSVPVVFAQEFWYTQVVWAPDARQVAAVRMPARSSGTAGELVHIDMAGKTVTKMADAESDLPIFWLGDKLYYGCANSPQTKGVCVATMATISTVSTTPNQGDKIFGAFVYKTDVVFAANRDVLTNFVATEDEVIIFSATESAFLRFGEANKPAVRCLVDGTSRCEAVRDLQVVAGQLVYIVDDHRNSHDVWHINLETNGVTIASPFWANNFYFSHDGKLVATYDGDIRVGPPSAVSAEEYWSKFKVVVNDHMSDQAMAWSPDDTALAYVDVSWQLKVVKVDLSGATSPASECLTCS